MDYNSTPLLKRDFKWFFDFSLLPEKEQSLIKKNTTNKYLSIISSRNISTIEKIYNISWLKNSCLSISPFIITHGDLKSLDILFNDNKFIYPIYHSSIIERITKEDDKTIIFKLINNFKITFDTIIFYLPKDISYEHYLNLLNKVESLIDKTHFINDTFSLIINKINHKDYHNSLLLSHFINKNKGNIEIEAKLFQKLSDSIIQNILLSTNKKDKEEVFTFTKKIIFEIPQLFIYLNKSYINCLNKNDTHNLICELKIIFNSINMSNHLIDILPNKSNKNLIKI